MKSPHKRTTVTVGICAFNEDNGIGPLIQSILRQRGHTCLIEKILVVNDMSTDNTAQHVKDISKRNPIVELYNQPSRSGKSAGLNYIFNNVTSDVLVTFDADIELSSPDVIESIVMMHISDSADLVCGRVDPLPASSYFGKIVYTYEIFWRYVIDAIHGGSNIHRCLGCCLGYSRKLYSQLQIPTSVQADDHFIYLFTKSKKLASAYSSKAMVGYRVPEKLADYIKQFTRYSRSKGGLEAIFGKSIQTYYKIPTAVKIKAYFQVFGEHPILMTMACLLQVVQRLSVHFTEQSKSHLWTAISSTK